MKLYLISQNVNNGYDTFDSAVVSANSEEDARTIHPGDYPWDGMREAYGPWTDSNNVVVEYLGEYAGVERGVICASFNAG
jgi:hypothetical protein